MGIAWISPRFDGIPNGLKASECYGENASSPLLMVPSELMSPHSSGISLFTRSTLVPVWEMGE